MLFWINPGCNNIQNIRFYSHLPPIIQTIPLLGRQERCFSTEVWVTPSLFKFPGLPLVFWMISTVLLFGWLPLVLLFPILSVLFLILLWLYRAHYLQSVSTFTFVFHSFFQFSCKVQLFVSLFVFLQFYSAVSRNGKVHNLAGSLSFFLSFFFFCWLSLGLVIWPRLDDLFVSQNPREFCASHFSGQILGFANIIFDMLKFKVLAQFPVDRLAHPVIIIIRIHHQ